MGADAKRDTNRIRCQHIGDVMDCAFVHAADYAKSFSIGQANKTPSRQFIWHDTIGGMNEDKERPWADIAERLKWHREEIVKIPTQQEYAASIGFKRSAYSLWEAGTHRLSMDGALALRRKYGLSIDFMMEGIDDALPMTLRNAWRERS